MTLSSWSGLINQIHKLLWTPTVLTDLGIFSASLSVCFKPYNSEWSSFCKQNTVQAIKLHSFKCNYLEYVCELCLFSKTGPILFCLETGVIFPRLLLNIKTPTFLLSHPLSCSYLFISLLGSNSFLFFQFLSEELKKQHGNFETYFLLWYIVYMHGIHFTHSLNYRSSIFF